MKKFEDVQIGERVSDPFGELEEGEGIILDKGSFDYLISKGYHSFQKGEILEYLLEEEELQHCVAISMDPERTFGRITSEIFIYGEGDPLYVFVE